jgi:hypothetical protein
MSFWIFSRTVKLDAWESKRIIRSLRVGNKRVFRQILIGAGLLPGWWGKIASAVLGLSALQLEAWADRIQKALRRSPVLGTNVRIGLKPRIGHPPFKAGLEASPRRDYKSVPPLSPRPPR